MGPALHRERSHQLTETHKISESSILTDIDVGCDETGNLVERGAEGVVEAWAGDGTK